ncbi:MAG: ADP-ribosylglycohydrolase family protein [Phycisphaerales bacterium]
MTPYDHILGCLIGVAVGDAIGLPREGLSPRRAVRLFGTPPLSHALIWGKGMVSDDTEHTVMVAQSLAVSGADPAKFRDEFARRLRWWFLRLPAGVGLGTLRACLKLWLGVSPERSGVRSAGNGPAMRSALIGVVAGSCENLSELVRAATRVTHTDPRAQEGAFVVAMVTNLIRQNDSRRIEPDVITERVLPLVNDGDLASRLRTAIEYASQGMDRETYALAAGLDNGVSGFVNHTVPAAVYCWLSNQNDFRQSVETAVVFGGDTDTVAAIVGALAGTQVGIEGIPNDWIAGLAEWPCSVTWMTTMAQALADMKPGCVVSTPPGLNPLTLFLRNLVFIPIVLTHGFRRLLPPY